MKFLKRKNAVLSLLVALSSLSSVAAQVPTMTITPAGLDQCLQACGQRNYAQAAQACAPLRDVRDFDDWRIHALGRAWARAQSGRCQGDFERNFGALVEPLRMPVEGNACRSFYVGVHTALRSAYLLCRQSEDDAAYTRSISPSVAPSQGR